jgi:hypothetical protein
MKRVLVVAVLALLAACGSSSHAEPQLFGGFTPVDGTAVIFDPTTCDIPFVGTTSASALAMEFTSFAGTCDFVTTTNLCGSKANSTFLAALAIGGVVGSGTAAPFAPGTYPFLSTPPTGAFQACTASAARTDASCSAGAGASPDMAGGRIVVTTVTATRVTGSLDLRFDDGSTYQRPFDLALCPVTADLCSLVGSSRCVAGFSPWVCLP